MGPGFCPMFFPLVLFSPAVGQWYHLAVTRSGSTYTIYINGAASGSATNAYTIPDPNAPLTIGQAENLGFMKGRLDEVTVYNRALAPEEIQAVYNAGTAGKCISMSIQPAAGGDTGNVTVQITGTGFEQGASVALARSGLTSIVGSPVTVAPDGTWINTTFALNGQLDGGWDVVVTNPDNATFSLPTGFTIEPGSSPQVWVDVIGLPVFRPGSLERIQVLYGNTGNVDASDTMLWVSGFSQSDSLTVDGQTPASTEPQPPATMAPRAPQTYNLGSQSVLAVRLGRLSAGGTGALDLNLAGSTAFAQQAFDSAFYAGTEDLGILSSCPPTDITCAPATDQAALQRALHFAWQKWGSDNLFSQAFATQGLCIGAAARLEADMLQDSSNPNSPLSGWGFQLVNGCGVVNSSGRREHDDTMITSPYSGEQWLIDDAVYPIACRMISIGPNTWVTPGCGDFAGCTWGPDNSAPSRPCRLPKSGGSLVQQPINSFDPNLKVGSSGIGTQAVVPGNQPLRYAISFQNSPSATAPVQEAVITDLLDTSTVDLSTLNLGPISFGNNLLIPPPASTTFAKDLDLRPTTNLIVRTTANLNSNTGLITWRLSSIDPATGNPPTDPRVGFLPPDVNPPQGDGSLLFTVMPKQGLATGTQIQNQATITFDTNAPINTPTWVNTLDNTPPSSRVSSLATGQSCSNFKVQWSGSDAGAGTKSYSLYASDDAAAFAPWLTNTTSTSSIFQGQVGHTYGFYSIATDLVGNIEPTKSAAEATTQVKSSSSCTPPSLSGMASVVSYANGSLSLNLNLTDIGTSDALNTLIKTLTFRTLGGTGSVTLVSPKLPITVGTVSVNNTITVPLNLNVPASVTKFSVTEGGTIQDSSHKTYSFSLGQNVVP